MFLSFTRWLSKAKNQSRKPHRAAKRAATVSKRYIPCFEPLETRVAPATLTVTNLTDTGVSGDGSLRGEIAAAQTAGSGNTVNFTPGLTGVVNLNNTNGNLQLTTGITIDGSGAAISR